MAKKKVMLFIVEGPTDETSLSTVLNRIFSSATVKFQVVHGDILTRDFTSSDKIVAAVWAQVKEFMGSIYRKSDICRIVHLTDMDGVFIPDDAVVENDTVETDTPPYYTETQIQTPNRAGILDRNQRKRNNIDRLSACPKVAGIPYSMYYFSLNLEHILHGGTNLSDWEKIRCAEEFDLKYGDDPDGFTLFKTNEQLLSDYVRCDPGYAAQQMMDTKRALGKTAGRQCYHIIQSFKPDEITPELAHEIARQFAAEHLPGYEAVIATHVDKAHIHSHIVFNSVNAVTGKMYHSTCENYYRQIRGVSDRLCKAHGLSIVLENGEKKTVSYAEWLRQKKSQPTFRSMLEADLHDAIEDANDLGHFFLLMEHSGYEIHHGKRLGFRLRGQEHFMCPERRNPDFSEERIEQAILGNLEQIEA